MGSELKERVKKLLRLSLERQNRRKVEGLDAQRITFLKEMTSMVAPYFPAEWFELLRYWLLLEYEASLQTQGASVYIYLQKAVLVRVEETVRAPWFPGERLLDSWV